VHHEADRGQPKLPVVASSHLLTPPQIENPEDTEYFDARGATLQTFAEELEDENSPQPAGAMASKVVSMN
jgi:hypothetical protein